MDRARVERLVADVRAARERQDPFAFVDLGGRLALRLQGAGGVRTSFVTSEERAAIEAAIEASPRGFVVGTVEVRFDERVRSYVARDGGVSLLFVDLPEDPPSAVTLALLSERYLWVHANEPRICEEAAVHLDRREWRRVELDDGFASAYSGVVLPDGILVDGHDGDSGDVDRVMRFDPSGLVGRTVRGQAPEGMWIGRLGKRLLLTVDSHGDPALGRVLRPR